MPARLPKRRFALLLAYDGTAFAGWQRQPGQRTVQETVGEALLALGIKPAVHGASRTDRGVHARAMVASLGARIASSPAALRRALAVHLPPDIRLRAVAEVGLDFHAQFASAGKRYRYQLWLSRGGAGGRFAWCVPDPSLERFARAPFSQARLMAALAAMEGQRTFAGAMHRSARRGVCHLVEARVIRQTETVQGRKLVVRFTADRYGKYLVRTLMGIAVRAAVGELDPSALSRQLDAELPLGQLVAPPQGLALWKVLYPDGRDPFSWLS